MPHHREFLPTRRHNFGYHYHLPVSIQRPLTTCSPTRKYTHLVQCLPIGFQRAEYSALTHSLIVKIKQRNLIWSTDFGLRSLYNESGHISSCGEEHAHLVKAAVKALRKVAEIRKKHPSVTLVVVSTEDAELVRRAAWGEGLDGRVYTRMVRGLYADLGREVDVLERTGCEVRFWLR